MVLKSIAGVLTLIAIIVLPMAVLRYGFGALSWGLRNYPGRTWLVILGVVALLFVGATTIGRVFPGCYSFAGFFDFGECGTR